VRRLIALLIAVTAAAVAVAAQDTDDIANLTSKGARISRGLNASLTGPSNNARPQIVTDFLAARHDAATGASLVTDTEDPLPNGMAHVRMHQRVAGLDVYGTYVKATLTGAGEIVSVIENLAPAGPALLPANVDHRGALTAALQRRYPGTPDDLPEVSAANNRVEFASSGRFLENPAVTRVAVPQANGRLRTGYLVETWDTANQLWHTIVSGNGRVIYEELRTASDRYNVFTVNPTATAQAIVSGPGGGNAESPIGWVTNNTTIGNNADAYLDRDSSNTPDAGGRPVVTNQDFLQAFSLTTNPTTTTNQMAAVTNLFYLNNVIHDKLYHHGFTEAAGNFQTNNLGKGGAGNDPVNAEAQDGSGTNNANFATPGDGSRPRMQMYLWTTATPNRDGDVDSDVVFHEYGHGLTWRMIGGMSGLFAGAIGEGQSDVLAIFINDNDRLGEYSANNTAGIRRAPYTNYPNTYGDMNGRVHDDGEIYAGTMWRLRQLWQAAGLSDDALWNRMIDGMNFTPSRPAYEDMRDGILAAVDAANSADEVKERCQVWTAFAQFGIGSGANGTESCNIIRCTGTVTESFAVPAGVCSAPTNNAPTVDITSPTTTSFPSGTSITFAANAADQDGDPVTVSWTSSRDGAIGSGTSFSTSSLSVGQHVITATASDGQAQGTDTITVTITAPTAFTLSGRGFKVKGVRNVDLTWTTVSGTNIDVFRNGSKVATTANDGAYTDPVGGKGPGSFTYQVCVTGSSTCSNTITINF
jgi:extracellular elastinolytic metalloproteinase